MGRKRNEYVPTLAEAWTHLGAQLGLQVQVRDDHSIEAHGTVGGRGVSVIVERTRSGDGGLRFFFDINTVSSRNRREHWHTVLAVRCVNPTGLTGRIASFVDINDPAWVPGVYDPRAGRHVRSDPPELMSRVLDADTYERLMSISDDLTLQITADAIIIDEESTALPSGGATYIAGSFLHHFQGPPPPMPDRAVIGPPRWIALLCDIAAGVDR